MEYLRGRKRRKFSNIKGAENKQVSMLQCCWMFNAVSLVSQKAASSLKSCFLCWKFGYWPT
ncbi:hypothetical protein FXE88_11655 [Vibrio cholerae]|nr:hypothetical protein FXE88_11655 [Vibrio cholerae]